MLQRFPLLRSLSLVALAIAGAGFASCSGGGGGGGGSSTGTIVGSCNDANSDSVLCLIGCNLGCNSAGCSISNIAQNQPLVFQFNQQLNPITVNSASVSIRTATGDEPVGQLIVAGNQVEFIPDIQIVGGQAFFGFLPGETYTLTIIGGADDVNAIRAVSGDPLNRNFRCTLSITQGIVDLNGAPPAARIVSPTNLTAAPVSSSIVLEFNELIDPAPFTGTNSLDGPVQFRVRQTRPDGMGGRECSPTAPPIPLEGTPQLSVDPAKGVTLLSFTPLVPLPGEICFEAAVTNKVVDFSGNQALAAELRFVTESIPRQTASIRETFQFPNSLNRAASSGNWGTNPATGAPQQGGFFGRLGGDGRHGSLTGDTLALIGNRVSDLGDLPVIYEIDTESTSIPDTMTLTGVPLVITDGLYQFTDIVIPSNTVVRFVGSRPAIIEACGRIEVRGVLSANGEDALTKALPTGETTNLATAPNVAANYGPDITQSNPLYMELVREGSRGGPGGGPGGDGGVLADGVTFDPLSHGQPGGSGWVAGTFPFPGQIPTTGGRGSLMFPASGLSTDINYTFRGIEFPANSGNVFFQYCIELSGAAGSGGNDGPGGAGNTIFLGAGDPPLTLTSNVNPPVAGPHGAAGTGVTRDPAQRPAGVRSRDYYLVGGGGGGGTGSSPLNDIKLVFNVPGSLDEANYMVAGAGGAGGGGAMALVAGDTLRIDFNGVVSAAGGSGPDMDVGIRNARAPGPAGAGAGGSLLMQSGRLFQQSGLLDVRGGDAGYLATNMTNSSSTSHRIELSSGDGAPGFLRAEFPGGSGAGTSALGNVLPAQDPRYLGDLGAADGSDFAAFQSSFYIANAITPFYQRYELEVEVDNGSGPVTVLYSDDPSVPGAVGPAVRGLTPVFVQFQAADVDPVTLQPRNPPTKPWRTNVGSGFGATGIAEDGFNGVRFRCVLDRSTPVTAVVRRMEIIYEF